jgi:hypothetical protein
LAADAHAGVGLPFEFLSSSSSHQQEPQRPKSEDERKSAILQRMAAQHHEAVKNEISLLSSADEKEFQLFHDKIQKVILSDNVLFFLVGGVSAFINE